MLEARKDKSCGLRVTDGRWQMTKDKSNSYSLVLQSLTIMSMRRHCAQPG